MRYRLRTLLIVLALGPPLLWGGYVAWGRYSAWREQQLRQSLVNTARISGPSSLRIISIPARPKRAGPPGQWDYQYPPASHRQLRIQPPGSP